ncbi:SRPBCC family protein [Agrococcus sp. Marseille-Q4369]|nr:SRPBCC family protein [Agrococcus sp. Marseille-Q4369]
MARGDREPHDGRAEAAARVDRADTIVAAPPQRVYEALLDANALRQWLAPDGATATIEAFDGREGGGFRAVLRFDAPVDAKSGDDVDVSRVTFVELVPNELVVQRVAFESAEERFAGDMLMTWRMQPVEAGTRVTVAASDVPPGISPADHELGLGQSLAKLAAYVEG